MTHPDFLTMQLPHRSTRTKALRREETESLKRHHGIRTHYARHTVKWGRWLAVAPINRGDTRSVEDILFDGDAEADGRIEYGPTEHAAVTALAWRLEGRS